MILFAYVPRSNFSVHHKQSLGIPAYFLGCHIPFLNFPSGFTTEFFNTLRPEIINFVVFAEFCSSIKVPLDLEDQISDAGVTCFKHAGLFAFA